VTGREKWKFELGVKGSCRPSGEITRMDAEWEVEGKVPALLPV
jgi:hypothetical protein